MKTAHLQSALLIGGGGVAIEFHLPRMLAILGAAAEEVVEPDFAQDRLLSMRMTREQFPDLKIASLESNRGELSRDRRFRFRDEVLT